MPTQSTLSTHSAATLPDDIADRIGEVLPAQDLSVYDEGLDSDALDGAYDDGFRDALESACLALLSAGVDRPVIDEMVTTVLDAHANNAC